MRMEKAYWISLVSLLLLGIVAITGEAAETYDQITVNIPYTVTIGNKVLEPGDYQIRQVANTKVQISKTSGDPTKVEAQIGTLLFTFAEPAKETKLILHRSGNNYLLDQIWIQGKGYYYKFAVDDPSTFKPMVPESESSTEKQVALVAKYEPIPAASGATVAQTGR